MTIIIPSDKAAEITTRLGLPEWSQLNFQQKRQVATEIYADDKSAQGKQIYTLLATGNSNANNFSYEVVVKSKPATNWPMLVGIGIVAWLVLR